MLMTGMIFLITSTVSSADDNKELPTDNASGEIETKWAPPSVVYSISTIGQTISHDGKQMRCYTVEEGKQVIIPMFADYRALFKAAWLWEAQRAEYEAIISTLKTKLVLRKGAVAFYKDDSEHWRAVAKMRVEQLESSGKMDWVPWTLVVLESLAFGVVGVWAASK